MAKPKKGLFGNVSKEMPSPQAMIFVFGMWLIYIVNRQFMILGGALDYEANIVSLLVPIVLSWVAHELSVKGTGGM